MKKKRILSLVSLIGSFNVLAQPGFVSFANKNLVAQELDGKSEDWEEIEYQVMDSLCRKDFRLLARELLYFSRSNDGQIVSLQCKNLTGMPDFPICEIKNGKITPDLCRSIARTFLENVISYRLTNMKLSEKSPFLELSPMILSNETVCTLAEKLMEKWKKDNVYKNKLEMMISAYGLGDTIEALYEKFLENEKKEKKTLISGQPDVFDIYVDKVINNIIKDIVNRLDIRKDGKEWLFNYEIVLDIAGIFSTLRYNSVQMKKDIDKEAIVDILTSDVLEVLNTYRTKGYVGEPHIDVHIPLPSLVKGWVSLMHDNLKLIDNWEKEGIFKYKVRKMAEPYAEKVMKKYEKYFENFDTSSVNSSKTQISTDLDKKLELNKINDKIENSVFNWIKRYCEKVFKGEDKLIARDTRVNAKHDHEDNKRTWGWYLGGAFQLVVRSRGWVERSKEDMKKDFNRFVDFIIDFLIVRVQLKRVGITKLLEVPPDLSEEMLFLEEVLDKWKSENVFENKKSEIIDELFKIYKSTNIN